MTTPKTRSPKLYRHSMGIPNDTYRQLQELTGQEVPTNEGRRIFVKAIDQLWQTRFDGQVTAPPPTTPEPATHDGPLTLNQLDQLPDPGRIMTPDQDAICALCGEVIKAGTHQGLWIRTKYGGGKQYLHASHQTAD